MRNTPDENWQLIYCNLVALLIKEYSDKGWGAVDDAAMGCIITKAKAAADLHYRIDRELNTDASV